MKPALWRSLLGYGALLGVAALGLAWIDYQRMARLHSEEVLTVIVGAGFLVLGVFAGWRLFGHHRVAAPFDGNPQAVAALNLSARELEVLAALAAGKANKEIARDLDVSPNTVKTHVANLYAKLGARRRTDAVHRARELGILP